MILIGEKLNSSVPSAKQAMEDRNGDLVAELAKKHGMTFLSITNNYKNLASKRVCEKLGAELMRLTMVPIDSTIRKQGQVFQNNYYWYL